jgi:hypothetical protein
MRRALRHNLLATLLILVGVSQAGFALTRGSQLYAIFYLVFGAGLTLIGVLSLWLEWNSNQ